MIAPIDWQPRTPTDSTFASDLTRAIRSAIAESLDAKDVEVVSAYNWERSKDSGQDYRNDRYRKQGYQFLVWGLQNGITIGAGEQLRVEVNVIALGDGTTPGVPQRVESGTFLADFDTAKVRYASLADNVLRIVQGRPVLKSVLARCFSAADPVVDQQLRALALPQRIRINLEQNGFAREHNFRIEAAQCGGVEPRRSWEYMIGGTVLPNSSNWEVSLEVFTDGRSRPVDNGFRHPPSLTDPVSFSLRLASYIRRKWCQSLVSCQR
jgi:hypothetical protein